MNKRYRPYEPDQMFLLPPSLRDWLPEGHLVFFVRDVLETIDLSPITDVYEDELRGDPPYHPKVLTAVLLYGYSTGIFSSRKLAKHCVEDVAFRVLAANNTPDHRTISDFRKRHLEVLKHVFSEVLHLCRKAGLVKFNHISLDGTKIKAHASKHKAMSYGRMKKDIKRLESEIADLLEQAQTTDEQEDRHYGKDKRGDELPEELARRETRLVKIREAKRALEAEARQQAEKRKKTPTNLQRPGSQQTKTTRAASPVLPRMLNGTSPSLRAASCPTRRHTCRATILSLPSIRSIRLLWQQTWAMPPTTRSTWTIC